MIEEQFVSFDTAKMLKEAGFDITCLYCYTSDGEKEETHIPIAEKTCGKRTRMCSCMILNL